MFGLNNSSGIPVMPAIAEKLTENPQWFTEGGNGVEPSSPGQDWFNMIQGELLNVLAAANVYPESRSLSQLAKSIHELTRSISERSKFYSHPNRSFSTGVTITEPLQCLYNELDENLYAYIGDIYPWVVNEHEDPTTQPELWRCIGDGTFRWENNQHTVFAENYSSFEEAVNTGKSVVYYKNHNISTSIQLHENQEIIRKGDGCLSLSGAGEFKLASGVVFDKPKFMGPATKHALVASGGISNVVIKHPKCTTCCLIKTNTNLTYAEADWIGKSNIVKGITIINPIGTGDYEAGADNTFMQTHYIDGFNVWGGRADNYYFGHFYWGGDSSFERDGSSRDAVRKCDNINLFGFDTRDCYLSGMWGSMAQTVRRYNCKAIRTSLGGDVGIDDEGTVDAINSECTARGYRNGNFAGFFGFSSIKLIDCTSDQYAGYPHYRNYNVSQNKNLSGDVVIDGGVYKTIDPINGFASIDAVNGSFRSFKITPSTELENTIVNLHANNSGTTILTGFHQKFSFPGVSAFSALTAYANNNAGLVVSNVKQSWSDGIEPYAGSIGIVAETADFNYQNKVVVANNDTGPLSIALLEKGANAGVAGQYWCYGNIASPIIVYNNGAKPLNIVRGDNNFTPIGAPITI